MSVNSMYADFLTFLVEAFKCHNTINQCKKRTIPSHANIGTGMKFGAALTDGDITRTYGLTTVALDTHALTARIPAILGASHSLFMCHNSLPYEKTLHNVLFVRRFRLNFLRRSFF